MRTGEIRRWAAQSRRLRAGRVLALRAVARLVPPGTGAPIFLNSIPKAGTHVVTQVLDELPGIHTTGVHLVKADVVRPGSEPIERSQDVDWTRVRSLLARSARRGQYVTAHTWAHPELFELLDELGFAQLFVVRDPRDIVVSQAAYVKRLRRHPDHRRFATGLSDDQARFRAIIEGYAADGQGPAAVSLAERLEGFAPWLDRKGVLTIRFEDLIGPSGGGSRERQIAGLTAIGTAIGAPLTPTAAEEVAARTWSPRAATFNRGRIGAWRESFDARTRERFEATVPDELMARYGYGP